MLWAFLMPLPYYAHFVPKEQRQPLSDILSYKKYLFYNTIFKLFNVTLHVHLKNTIT